MSQKDIDIYAAGDDDYEAASIVTRTCKRIAGCSLDQVSGLCQEFNPSTLEEVRISRAFCNQMYAVNDFCGFHAKGKDFVCVEVLGDCVPRYPKVGSTRSRRND